jgi:alpha-galactosidase
MQAANAMVDLGFKDAGYEYVVLDDCWSEMKGRDPVTSRLVPNTTKFPDGMSGTADKVHELGLKYGMYSSAGTMTCGRYPGSLGYEAIDAATFAEWGVDYLKVSQYRSVMGRVGWDKLLLTSHKSVPFHASTERPFGVHTNKGPN